jgi:hypothetical protein
MSSSHGLVPIHVGQHEPGSEQDRLLRLRVDKRNVTYTHERLPRVSDGLDWQKHGLQPRWLGKETSGCAAVLEPSIFYGRGADELERFFAGARQRGELALAVTGIGDADNDLMRSPLSDYDCSIGMGKTFTMVNGRRLPVGTRLQIATKLSSADRDLALRLLNRPADAPWWSLHLGGSRVTRGDASGTRVYEAQGQLTPILVDELGDPVVAAWISPSGDQRWYIIPDAVNWDWVLGWLIQQALPEYVPSALQRARSPFFADPDLQTRAEAVARLALEDLEKRHAVEKLRLEAELGAARELAEPVRYGLLYCTGAQLVHAVAEVLATAGLVAVDLDRYLGGTRSADLLVSGTGSARYLVEVKAANGAAAESLVGDLVRHLTTWPQLRPGEPVAGGVLVVNHHHRLAPSERPTQVYVRPEFVAALTVRVIAAVDLFHWWRAENWSTIRTAFLGNEAGSGPTTGAG